MRKKLLIIIFLTILMVYSPVSSALWVKSFDITASDQNEIVINLKLFQPLRDFGVEHGGEKRLLFIREKSDTLSYSFLNVDCSPEDVFVVRDEWIMYNNTVEIIKMRGYLVAIAEEIRTNEIEISIKLSWNAGYSLPFQHNNVSYPFDEYHGDIFLMFFTEENSTSMVSPFTPATWGSDYVLVNRSFFYDGTYKMSNYDYYVEIYETHDMGIKRPFFEVSVVGIFLWILVLLLFAIIYMVWNCYDCGKVIRLYMGFFVPTLFLFGYLQNIGSLANMPFIIFGSILLISTLLLIINIFMDNKTEDKRKKKEKDRAREYIRGVVIIWGMITLFMLFITRNSFDFIFKWLSGNGNYFLFFTSCLSSGLIMLFILSSSKVKKIKEKARNKIDSIKSNFK